jgi:hypothetical protein
VSDDLLVAGWVINLPEDWPHERSQRERRLLAVERGDQGLLSVSLEVADDRLDTDLDTLVGDQLSVLMQVLAECVLIDIAATELGGIPAARALLSHQAGPQMLVIELVLAAAPDGAFMLQVSGPAGRRPEITALADHIVGSVRPPGAGAM